MTNSVNDMEHYNATTIKLPFLASQIITQIELETPFYYQKKNVIKVNALWDTGAMRSCISKCMALKLGLFPTDYSKAYGIGGENRTEVYDILVNLNSAVKNIPLQVSCGKLHRDDGGSPFSEIGFLVGMDIIGMGDFFTGLYAGENKVPCTMMSFRFPSALHPVDYLEDFGNRD